MSELHRLLVILVVATGTWSFQPSTATADYRQRYSAWEYYPEHQYYYSYYYYKPVSSYGGYKHHYCIHYPGTRYVYYYNPVRRVYWGRYDLESKAYSLLAPKDRKSELTAIPESAFPPPGEMPPIPDSTDGTRISRISVANLPGQ